MNRIPNVKQYAKAERDMARVFRNLGIGDAQVKAEALVSDILIREIERAMS